MSINKHTQKEIHLRHVDYDDPATWIKLDNHIRQMLIEHEPEPIEQFAYERDDEQKIQSKQFVEERYTMMQKISLVFGFLLHSKPRNEIMEHCLNLE